MTGTGAAGTGGTIRTTGGDAVALTSTAAPSLRYMALGETAAAVGEAKSTVNAVAGAGISMTTVTGATFRDIKIARTGSHGIVGTGVAGMTLADTDVLNAGDADNENGLEFASGASNLSGTVTLTNVRVDGAASWGLRVLNTSGTLTLGVSGGQFTNTRNVPGGLDNVGEDGIQFNAQGTATITATVANATFATLESDGIQGVTSGTGLATLNLTATGNAFTGYRDGPPIPAVPAGNRSSDNAVELNATGTTRLRYTVAGNTMTNSENQAVLLGGNDASTVDGRVVNNVIDGTASNYGIEANPIADETASVRLLVDGNTVRNTELEAMTFSANLSGVLNLTVTNNSVPTRPRNLAATFEQIQARALGSSNVCWDVRGNTSVQGGTGAGPASGAVRLFRPSTATVLPRLERGSSPLGTPALTVAQNNNPAAATPFVVTSTVSVVENGTCVDPIATPTSLADGTVALSEAPPPAAEAPAETRRVAPDVAAGPVTASVPAEPTAEVPAILPTAAPDIIAAPIAEAPVEIAPPTLAVDAAEKAVGVREPAALEAAAGRTAAPADGQRSGETVTATIGTLPAGKTVTIFYDATLAAPFPAGYGVTASGSVSGSNVATLALQRFTPVVQTLTRTRAFAGVPAPDVDAGWRLLAAPVTGLTVATLAGQNLVQGVPGYYPTYGANLFTDFTGSAFVAPAGGADALASGRGFFWYFYDRAITPPGGPSQSVPLPFTLTGTGVATSGPVTVPLRVGVQNMLGNPFTSALDVSGLATWATGGTVQAVGQVYDDATQSYLPTTLTGDRVEVWQGLFVGVNTATALVVPPTAQIAPAALADGEAAARAEPSAATKAGATETRLVAFELRGTAAGTGQPTVDRAAALYFHPDATPEWDAYDVAKLFPPTAAFALLAFEGPHDGAAAMKAQESRPFELAGLFAVPLHVDVQGTAGPLTLTWPLLQNIPAEWSLRLTDVVANQTVDLRAAASYTFDAPARPATAADGAPLGAVAGAVGERFVLTVSAAATGPEGPASVPGTFALAGMLPNPVRDAARVRFDVPEAATVTVEVFDVLGRLAATVVDGPVAAGRHDVAWRRGTFPSGTYVLRMRARADGGGAVFVQTRRMTVAR